MPRKSRVDLKEYWYHIVARGQRKDRLFLDDADRHFYLAKLFLFADQCGVKVGCYCLMDNHVHILIFLEAGSIGAMFRKFHSAYAIYFNHQHDTVGYVFQGRPKSFPVLDYGHLRTLIQYIHRNPPGRPSDYAWSSDAFYRFGKSLRGESIAPVPGFDGPDASQIYRTLVDDARVESCAAFDEYIGEVERSISSSPLVLEPRTTDIESRVKDLSAAEKIDIHDLRKRRPRGREREIRQKVIKILSEESYMVDEIARFFNVTTSAIRQARRRC